MYKAPTATAQQPREVVDYSKTKSTGATATQGRFTDGLSSQGIGSILKKFKSNAQFSVKDTVQLRPGFDALINPGDKIRVSYHGIKAEQQAKILNKRRTDGNWYYQVKPDTGKDEFYWTETDWKKFDQNAFWVVENQLELV